MQIMNIAGYKFIPLTNLQTWQTTLLHQCQTLMLKGTILLSEEGINISLAGTPSHIQALYAFLETEPLFAAIHFHETYSPMLPFSQLKVKIKKEIITLKQPNIDAVKKRAASVTPQELKNWLDEKKDITLLDTRNDYEVRFGTFVDAHHLPISDFSEFPEAVKNLERDKPIVMFCTGGIRCEKAALYLEQAGYENVYQLDTGILGYFAQVGGAHYMGECFVFDERIAVDPHLQMTGTKQCVMCEGPVRVDDVGCRECR